MAFVIADRVKETSTTTGTGTLTLAGAVTGFTTFAAVGNGNTCTYAIIAVDANGVPTGEWETGIGTYTSSGTTLSRGVIKSSNANALVSFSAGTKHVICTDVAGYATPLVMATTANRAIQVADQTALSSPAGNARGKGAVDLQIKRGGATQVASGFYATISGGSSNYATGAFASVGGGNYCKASGNYGRVGGGRSILNTGSHAVVGGGASNNCTGNYAFIGGGKINHAYTSYSVICGGKSNTAQTNAYATVAGGQYNTASGKYGFVGSGKSCTASGKCSSVSGGKNNVASAPYSFIGGGFNNTASTKYCATILGGGSNTASNFYAVVAGGRNNTASAKYSSIVGGGYARADKHGQSVQCSGAISAAGDAQASKFVLRKQTTNGTQTEIFLDNSSARMTLSNDTTWAFWGYLIARNTGTDSENACWKFDGQISRNTNAASTAVAGVTTTTINLDMGAAAWTITVDADTTNGSLRIRVTGENSKTINWVAVVHTVEVTG